MKISLLTVYAIGKILNLNMVDLKNRKKSVMGTIPILKLESESMNNFIGGIRIGIEQQLLELESESKLPELAHH